MEDKSNRAGNFGTFSTRGILTAHGAYLSGSMEDYLEMIYRISKEGGAVRIKELSAKLGVSPSSASRMTGILRTKGLVNFEKYSYITLTENGRVLGEYLLFRHGVVHSFLCRLNKTKDELSQTEAIEHYLTDTTVSNMERLLKSGVI